MTDLIDTTEMYLKTIYELIEEGITPLRARIAERLDHSGPTVSQTVARMERDDLVVVSTDRHLQLTALGTDRAMRVMRKHRLAERLLIDVIGLDWQHVHEEACRWEHVMSEDVERRLAALLEHPQSDPYGNPIPGLAELGEPAAAEPFLDGVRPLLDVVEQHGPQPAVLRRLGEPVQSDVELLAQLDAMGLRPGAAVVAERGPGGIALRLPGADTRLDLPGDLARHIFVAAAAE